MTAPDTGSGDPAEIVRASAWYTLDRWIPVAALVSAAAAGLVAVVHWITGHPDDWATPAGSLAGLAAALAGVSLYRATLGLVEEATRSTAATRQLADIAAEGVRAARDLIKATDYAAAVAEEANWLTVHETLRPRFDVTGNIADAGTGDPYLMIRLTGPDALERLDELSVSIVDLVPDHDRPEIEGVSRLQRHSWLWSWWRFAYKADVPDWVTADDMTGRNAKPQVNGITRADVTVYALEVNLDPRLSSLRDSPPWREAISNTRFKIEITAILRPPGARRQHTWVRYEAVTMPGPPGP